MRRGEPDGSRKRGRGRRRSRVEAGDEGAGGDEDEAGRSKTGARVRPHALEPRTRARAAVGAEDEGEVGHRRR